MFTLFQDAERWLANLQKQLRNQTPSLMPVDEVQERLHEVVMGHFYTLARLFAEIDYAKIGVIAKEDFREVLDNHVIRLTDEQVSLLTVLKAVFWRNFVLFYFLP